MDRGSWQATVQGSGVWGRKESDTTERLTLLLLLSKGLVLWRLSFTPLSLDTELWISVSSQKIELFFSLL